MARGGQLAFAVALASYAAWTGASRAGAPAAPRAEAAQAAAPTARAQGTASQVGASIFVTGNPMARACEQAAQIGDVDKKGLDACTLLLQTPGLSDRDRAATYVDRGAVFMQHKQFADAQADFDQALKIAPDLGNAYVNRGASLIGQKRYAEAIADIDKGVPLNADQPEKAYFNRAIANEALGDRRAAYADYQKALALHPNWAAAKAEIVRLDEIAAVKGP